MNSSTSDESSAARTVRFTRIGLRTGQLDDLHLSDADLDEMPQLIAAHVSERLAQPVSTDVLTVVGSPDVSTGHVIQRLFEVPGVELKVADFVVIDSRAAARTQSNTHHAWALYLALLSLPVAAGIYIGWQVGQAPGSLAGLLYGVLIASFFPKPPR